MRRATTFAIGAAAVVILAAAVISSSRAITPRAVNPMSPVGGVQEAWVARYNGPGNYFDEARAIAIDSAGNVYVTGGSVGSGTDSDYATVKYDSSGQEQWVARYNGPGNSGDSPNGIAIDSAGNVYVTGESFGSGTNDDYATVKYDSSGQEQWVARYNGPVNASDEANAIAIDSAGNVYVTGESVGAYYDYATVKYDSFGQEQWVARYNGPQNSADEADAIAVDGAGNVYVTGKSFGSGTDYDYATVKYDSSGQEQWVARYNGPGNGFDEADAIAVDGAGNVYVTGKSVRSSSNLTVEVAGNFGSQGIVLLSRPTPTPRSRPTPRPRPTPPPRPTPQGTDFDYATVKYDSSGQEQWVNRYNGPGNSDDIASEIAVDDVGNVYVTGGSVGSGTGSDYATIKYSQLPFPTPTPTPTVTPTPYGGALGPNIAVGWALDGVVDFNHDVHPDYALFNPSNGQTAIWYMLGPTRIASRLGQRFPVAGN